MIYGVKCFRKIKEYTEHGTLGDIIHVLVPSSTQTENTEHGTLGDIIHDIGTEFNADGDQRAWDIGRYYT